MDERWLSHSLDNGPRDGRVQETNEVSSIALGEIGPLYFEL